MAPMVPVATEGPRPIRTGRQRIHAMRGLPGDQERRNK